VTKMEPRGPSLRLSPQSAPEDEIERRKHKDDADIGYQPLPELMPEEQDVHGDHDSHQSEHARDHGGPSIATLHRPTAHATINGSSACQNASPCDPMGSLMTTAAPASRGALAHRVALSRKDGPRVPGRDTCAEAHPA
jgi:hypothetical protein